MEQKLKELRGRLQAGEQQLLFLDQKRTELRDSLLRISGAIEVLEELSASNDHKDASALEETVG